MDKFDMELKTPVPGLARGIALLQILGDRQSATLSDFVRLTDYPKSSIMRQLDTLQAIGVIARDEVTHEYFSLQRLIPVRMLNQNFDRMLNAFLSELARTLSSVAEWYVPVTDGMVLVRRVDSQQHHLQEMAQIGFVRRWNTEIDAISSLAYAWHENAPNLPTPTESHLRRFVRHGLSKPLAVDKARKLVELAGKRGYAWDTLFNDNAVRRAACVVRRENRMVGILVVAERQRPGVRTDFLNRLMVLTGKAKLMSQSSSPLFNPLEVEVAVRNPGGTRVLEPID